MANKLLEMKKRLLKSTEDRRKLLDAIADENRDPTEEEEKRLADLASEKKRTLRFIEEYEASEEERAIDLGADEEEDKDAEKRSKLPRTKIVREEGEDENGHYKPFKSFGEQLISVRRAAETGVKVDQRLLEINKRAVVGMNEQVGAEGGHLVQLDFSAELMRLAIETGVLASRCKRLPISVGKNGVEWPVVDETSRVDGSRWGGVAVYWAAEGEAAVKSKPKFSTERLQLHKLLGMCVATDEMLEDAPFLGSFITQAFQEEFGYKIDDGIIRGTGAGQMLGILNSPALVTVAKESGQANTTIVGANAVKMRSRLLGRSRKGAVWLTNQDAESELITLTITKPSSDIPLFNAANGTTRELDTILGYPVIPIEQAGTLGTVGDLILADLQSYVLIMRDMKQASSIHVYFDTEQSAFRFSLRINGQPMYKTAITPARGTNTLSAFVTLAGRP